MKQMNYATENEIQRLGLEALSRGLGVVGLIRFIQQFDKGHGDYVKDRQEWQEGYSLDSLLEAVAKRG
ncbi:MAG: hypothetical protein D3916_05340 [Candidatus Electrothrix sp. MAN1_4]|nr:hypothetical protein [Candidatus Electrothrix sp. MAN1_4]